MLLLFNGRLGCLEGRAGALDGLLLFLDDFEDPAPARGRFLFLPKKAVRRMVFRIQPREGATSGFWFVDGTTVAEDAKNICLFVIWRTEDLEDNKALKAP